MGTRLQLSRILRDILGSETQVYFQAPPNDKMQYPCIIYSLDNVAVQHADNAPYFTMDRYLITVIDRNPDSLIWREVMKLPTASFVRSYPSDNLNHFVINLHF